MKARTLALVLMMGPASADPVSLFDGSTLAGWDVREGEEAYWRVHEGCITGGSLERRVPHNTFLASARRYENFELRFKVRLVKGDGFMNSGIQVRSIRVDGGASHEMSGYQVDAGVDWWGKLYDESRRNRVIAEPVEPEAVARAARDWDWNEYVIRCEGPRIRSWINGVAALDYTEQDPGIPREGRIGLQAHGGGRFLVQFKEVTIEELPATPGAKRWPPRGPQSPADEMSFLRVPDGFEVELVASEEQGVGKPITVTWDARGRMWTMTALEYPVDANESPAMAKAVFERGGRDRVLVFDEPNQAGPLTPRVFADGLAIPLGMLPVKDGALVQYGPEIRRYEDRDRDGRAEGFRTLLEGFGIQDSHLFPHQFERAPGGWVYVAQGLFNSSMVRRADGQDFASGAGEVPFVHCKLARFRADGSDFELLSHGPNNIWGLATARDGEVFLQEANDLGIPVAEFIAGTHYKTGSKDKLRPYAPWIPDSMPSPQMGGTGLSGIAMAEDEGSPFAKGFEGQKVFYIANPITNRIQIITMRRDANRRPVYEKQPDFLVSDDKWFRPVAAHFGPDGALYVVDWYNKVISHNEVPRNHPERDKSRGRIWRIKAKGAPVPARVDLTALDPEELVGYLGGSNARLARLAWQEFGDRNDPGTGPVLAGLVDDAEAPKARRLGAFWALEEMGALHPGPVVKWSRDRDAHLRYEAIRAAGDLALGEATYLRLLDPAEGDFRVRCAMANSLRRQREATPAMVAGLAAQIRPPVEGGSEREVYESEFERYLIRWAFEVHAEATRKAFEGSVASLGVEQRIFMAMGLPPAQAAPLLLQFLPQLERPLVKSELELLGGQLRQAAVAEEFRRILGEPARRVGLLTALLQLDPALAAEPALREAVLESTRALVRERGGHRDLVFALARHFRLSELAEVIEAELARSEEARAEGLRALNEMGVVDARLFRSHLGSEDAAVAREAMIGFASVGGEAVVADIASRWDALPGPMRQFALNGLLQRRENAALVAARAADGQFPGLGVAALERMIGLLGADDQNVAALLEESGDLFRPAIRLSGDPDGKVVTGIDLEGAFTVEGWVRLDPGIDNSDGLLGRRDGPDFNFHDRRLRVYGGRGAGDLIVASQPADPKVWIHYAVTRDAEGVFTIFVDGEADPAKGRVFKAPLKGLNVGESSARGGTSASMIEFRIWDHARSAEQIRSSYQTRFVGLPAGQGPSWLFPGGHAELEVEGRTQVVHTADFPELRTPEQERALAAKFERLRRLAAAGGDPEAGRPLVEANCQVCHQIKGQGMSIGPDLSGAGAMGLDALLRNIVTPSLQLESGYYRHDVTLRDGTLLSGFLVEERKDSLVLRQIGMDDRAIPRKDVAGHSVSKRSLMPEGLLDAYGDEQVRDMIAYLLTLK